MTWEEKSERANFFPRKEGWSDAEKHISTKKKITKLLIIDKLARANSVNTKQYRIKLILDAQELRHMSQRFCTCALAESRAN